MLGGSEFRFVGANAYFLQPEIVYKNYAGVAETLDEMAELGLSVVRTIGFNDHPPDRDKAAIQVKPGVYNEQNLVALDMALAAARDRNIRVIIYLTGNWDHFGGVRRYIQWYREECRCQASQDDFFTNETVKQWYKGYVTMLLNRTNVVTGVSYANDPTIIAYELGNELRSETGNSAIVLEWLREMAEFIKTIDRNHLVGDGGEGFDDAPKLYPRLSNRYPIAGSTGNSYHRLVSIPHIDLVSYHLFPTKYELNETRDARIWISVHERLARAAGKVAYLGEFGTTGPVARRSRAFNQWLNHLVANKNVASLVWQIAYDGRPDSDGFTIYYPRDEAVTSILLKYARRTGASPTQ
jgi:mannan endo-1,4-beta-mannosidase